MLGFDLLKSGIFSVLPWITMALAANIGGFIADSLVSRGVSVTTVRKVMQTVRTRPWSKESVTHKVSRFWAVAS